LYFEVERIRGLKGKRQRAACIRYVAVCRWYVGSLLIEWRRHPDLVTFADSFEAEHLTEEQVERAMSLAALSDEQFLENTRSAMEAA